MSATTAGSANVAGSTVSTGGQASGAAGADGVAGVTVMAGTASGGTAGNAGSASGAGSAGAPAGGSGGQAPGLYPAAPEMLEVLARANQQFVAKWPDTGAPIVVNGTSRQSNIWTRAVYYEGLLNLYAVDPKPDYKDYALAWGNAHSWQLRSSDSSTTNADNQCAGQPYIDLYNLDGAKDAVRIAAIKTSIDGMVAIHGLLEHPVAPGIHERVAGAGVESGDRRRSVAGQHRQVGDAADVDHHAVRSGLPEDRLVKRRHQRGALAAERQVLAAEVRHDRDAGQGRDHIRITNLQGEGRRARGAVADGLAVAADGGDGLGLQGRFGQQFVDGLREAPAGQHVGPAEPVDLAFPGRAQRKQLPAQLFGVGQGVRRDQGGLRGEAHQRHVDAVDACARERADEEFRLQDPLSMSVRPGRRNPGIPRHAPD